MRLALAMGVLLILVQAEPGWATGPENDDRNWARMHATDTAPTSDVLRDYWSLQSGDIAAFQTFRALFSERTHHSENLGPIRYLLYIPKRPDTESRRPLIVWLHGRGDGESNLLQHFTGLARLFFPPPWRHDGYPFFFLSVLAPNDQTDWVGPSTDADDLLAVVMKIIDETAHQLPVDTTRIALAGASIGGTASWVAATRYPDRFSAIAPISSRGLAGPGVEKIHRVPVWAFQSTDDNLPIDQLRRTVHALQDAGGSAHLTEFPSRDHDAWTPAFDRYDLLNWLLSQQRGQAHASRPGHVLRDRWNDPREATGTVVQSHLRSWLAVAAGGVLLIGCLAARTPVSRRIMKNRVFFGTQGVPEP